MELRVQSYSTSSAYAAPKNIPLSSGGFCDCLPPIRGYSTLPMGTAALNAGKLDKIEP